MQGMIAIDCTIGEGSPDRVVANLAITRSFTPYNVELDSEANGITIS